VNVFPILRTVGLQPAALFRIAGMAPSGVCEGSGCRMSPHLRIRVRYGTSRTANWGQVLQSCIVLLSLWGRVHRKHCHLPPEDTQREIIGFKIC
jgi:hypothetical protein